MSLTHGMSSLRGGRSGSRPRVFYVSYDGMGEPLGRSQVLAYLFRLATDYDVTLASFEKPDADRGALRAELSDHGIEWLPLDYHRRPRVLSTLLDVFAGVRVLRTASRSHGQLAIVHVRSYVPALIALLARRWTRGKLIFDIRGFWADERVEGGWWPAGGWLYRVAKRCERWFFQESDAVVTLTHASVPQIRAWVGGRHIPIVVIPTCAELDRFAASTVRAGEPHVIWAGSVGTRYHFELVGPVAKALDLELDVFTRQTDLARTLLNGVAASVRELPPSLIPSVMCEGDIGLSFYVPGFSTLAAAPTRLAEYLAAGMVVISSDVGDVKSIVAEHGVGVVLEGDDEEAIADATRRARELSCQPGIPERCRRVARELFDVEAGSRRYAELYEDLLS